MRGYFTNVSVGDYIWVGEERYGIEHWQLEIVSKITPTQIVTGYSRYRRQNGYKVGRTMFSDYLIRLATPIEVKQRKEKEAVAETVRKAHDEEDARIEEECQAMQHGLPHGAWISYESESGKWRLSLLLGKAEIERLKQWIAEGN